MKKDKIICIGIDENRYSVFLEMEIRTRENPCRHWETLEEIKDAKVLSICGYGRWNSISFSYGGQIQDTIRENLDNFRKLYIPKDKILLILDIWDNWHLNDLQAGTRLQTEVLNVIQAERKEKIIEYTWCCDILKQYGLYEDKGYKYGHGWLLKPLPPDVEKLINDLFSIETPLWKRFKEKYQLV